MFGRKKTKDEVIVNVELVEGLPLHENTTVNLTLNTQSLVITDHSKNEFTLPFDKITSIEYKNEVEMEKLIQQSAPGMIIGAATFGLLGALVGGRTKTKNKKSINHFILINYYSDEPKTIVTTTNDTNNVKIVDFFRKLKPQQPLVTEL